MYVCVCVCVCTIFNLNITVLGNNVFEIFFILQIQVLLLVEVMLKRTMLG